MTKEEIRAKIDATRLRNLLKRKAAKMPLTERDKAILKKLLAAQPKGDKPKG